LYCNNAIIVVVPAYNEARYLPFVLGGIPAWVDRVIVVDDGSVDTTAVIAEQWGGRVRLVRHSENLGVGAALVSGYRAALNEGADVVAVMAGDGQMCPDELESLVEPVTEGRCHYCKGDRTSHPEVREHMPWIRRLGNHALTRWTRRVSGLVDLRDAQCGFTAISAPLLRKLPLSRLTPRYGYPNDLLVMLAVTGARVEERTVRPIYEGQESGIRAWKALWTHSRVLLRAWWWARRVRERFPTCTSVS